MSRQQEPVVVDYVVSSASEQVLTTYNKGEPSDFGDWQRLDSIKNIGPGFIDVRVGSSLRPWHRMYPGEEIVFGSRVIELHSIRVRAHTIPSTLRIKGVR